MTSLSVVMGDAQAQAHRTGATLSVDDPNGVGTLADDLLSFDEAIRIANGELELGALSAAERLRVKGSPGAERRDLIRLPAGVTITVEAGKALTPLIGNDGDTIDGTDAVMVAGEKGKGNGLLLASSNLVVIGYRARGFDKPLQVDFGGRKLRNITLTKMRLSMADSKGTLLIVAAQSGEGSLDGLKVTDSVFETGGKKEGNLVYIGSAAGEGAGRPISNTLLQNVLFSRNQIKDGAIGMYIHGAMSGRSTTNATTRRAVISDNVFAGQHDSPINVAGALPAVGATNTGITLEDVTITRNRLEAANWGIWMGHETFGFGVAPTFARKNRWRNISITDNIVRQGDFAGKAHCITLETASDSPGDAATDNVIENVRITGNDVRGCRNEKDGLGTGIVVYAGRNLSFGDRSISTATHNALRNLTIADNRVADSDRGIVVGGGYSLSVGQTTPHDGGDKLAKLDGSSTDNHLSGARIERNEIQDVTTGILVVGGEGAAGSKVHRNSAQVVIGRTNKVIRAASPCEVHANRQAASGNTVTAVCPRL